MGFYFKDGFNWGVKTNDEMMSYETPFLTSFDNPNNFKIK
jgi:hypothetical protein